MSNADGKPSIDRSHAAYVLAAALSATGLLLAVGVVNLCIDPLWVRPGSHRFNRRVFDARRQKTNRLHRDRSARQYDSLILGSSRTALLGHLEVGDVRLFNYSSEDLMPDEYEGYINFFRDARARPPRYVLIGMDFFGSSRHRYSTIEVRQPAWYIRQATSPAATLRNLLSVDTLQHSALSVRDALRGGVPPATPGAEWRFVFRRYYEKRYGEYELRPDLPLILASIGFAHPDSEIRAFVTPVSELLYAYMIEKGLFEQYRQWLRLSVEAFGSVHVFAGLNSVTTDPTNFTDENHLTPQVARFMVCRVLAREDSGVPADFGVRVHGGNIDAYLEEIRGDPGRLLGKYEF